MVFFQLKMNLSPSSLNSNFTDPVIINDSTATDFGDGDLYMIILPIIVVFGLIGNTISLVTIFHTRLRKVLFPNLLYQSSVLTIDKIIYSD